jgi:5'-3' exonuclease
VSPKTIKLYEQHVRDSMLRFIQEEPMQAVNMYPEEQSAPQPEMPRSIALFDFSHAINVAYNAAGPDSTADIVIGWLRALRSSCECVVLCLDSKPYWRAQVFEGYKAGRKQDPELANIWDRVLDQVVGEGFAVARADGEEADDVMASLARIYVEDYACEDVRLVTADKDISQCINNHVRWFYPQMGSGEFEIRDADWCKRHWGGVDWANEKQLKEGPAPDEIARVLSIMGDTSDKIPGIKGIGIKGAVWLVRTFGTPAKMAEALVAEQQVTKNKGKELSAFWRNFAAGMAELPKWLKLTTVNDEVELDKHPMKYLERVEPRQLVAEDAPSDDAEFMDDWGPSPEELAEERATMVAGTSNAEYEAAERAAMAASLPVDPAPLRTEPVPDPAERRAAMAAEADRVLPLPKGAPSAAPEGSAGAGPDIWTAPRSGAAHDPAKMVIGKDPKADELLRAVARANTTPKGKVPTEAEIDATQRRIAEANQRERERELQSDPKPAPSRSAETVPATQGPRKLQDEIPAPANLARVEPPSWSLAVQPQSAHEMLAISKTLFNSRLYSAYGTPQAVFAVMTIGRELGLGMAASLEAFHIVQGRPFAKAVTLRALAERHPDCEWIMVTSSDAKHATIKTKHRRIAEVLEYTYTLERAEQAGYLTGKNRENWISKTQEMLEARATSKAVRRWYPSAVMGMHAQEEALDD